MTALGIAGLAGAIALLLSLLLPVAVKPLLVRLGIMDVPNERSSHERPVLRGLGLAVLIAMTVAGLVAVWGLSASGPTAVPLLGAAGEFEVVAVQNGWGGAAVPLILVVLGSLCAGLLGLAEDLRGLSVRVRSAALLAIAAAAGAGIVFAAQHSAVDVGFVGGGAAGFGWWAFAPLGPLPVWASVLLVGYAVLFISSYINVANFMDGLNGISGFHGVIAGLAFAASGWCVAQPWLVAAGLVLAAGFGGFLPWNLTKPGAFLGDVGSYLLGGATAITSFAALMFGVPLLAAIGPMVISFGDVGVTLVKRIRAGHKWDEPHKEHTYQRIHQRGYTHVQASLMAASCSAIASILGLASIFVGPIGTAALFVGGLAVLGIYLALPKLLPVRAG